MKEHAVGEQQAPDYRQALGPTVINRLRKNDCEKCRLGDTASENVTSPNHAKTIVHSSIAPSKGDTMKGKRGIAASQGSLATTTLLPKSTRSIMQEQIAQVSASNQHPHFVKNAKLQNYIHWLIKLDQQAKAECNQDINNLCYVMFLPKRLYMKTKDLQILKQA